MLAPLGRAAIGALSEKASLFAPGEEGPVQPVYVNVMGVTACGKSTLCTALAAALGDVPYVKADPLHLEESKERSRHGLPLDDFRHRRPWLVDRVAPAAMDAAKESPSGIVVLDPSVLNPRLRRWLRDALGGAPLLHVNPHVTFAVALGRAIERAKVEKDHIIAQNTLEEKAAQMHGQFTAFKPLRNNEPGIELDGTLPTDVLLVQTLAFLTGCAAKTGDSSQQ